MWIWEGELERHGFRRRSRRYWQCERGFRLPAGAYISVYVTDKDTAPGRRRRGGHRVVEAAAFHVTFLLDVDNVHFYYHEQAEGVWEPGGHTSAAEIARHGFETSRLREIADTSAREFARALNVHLLPRE